MKTDVYLILEAIDRTWPDIFARHNLTNLSGGLINSRTVANRHSRGDGPPFVRIGKTIGLEKSSFLQWLKGDIQKASLKQKAIKTGSIDGIRERSMFGA
jgi:hypothetical protein